MPQKSKEESPGGDTAVTRVKYKRRIKKDLKAMSKKKRDKFHDLQMHADSVG